MPWALLDFSSQASSITEDVAKALMLQPQCSQINASTKWVVPIFKRLEAYSHGS